MRRVVLFLALTALLVPGTARAADAVTLSAQPGVASYDSVVRFQGATVPLAEVFLVERLAGGWTVVAQTRAGTDGSFIFQRRARKPGVFQARTVGGQSGEVATQVRPRLRARVRGSIVTGRVLPARAGTVVLRVDGRTRRLRVGSAGRFRVRIGYLRAGRHAVRVALRPRPGYVRAVRRFALRIRRPALRMGSHGPGVLELKRRLAQQGYALPSVDSGYGFATYEAVLAFQKVHGLPRTGRVDRRFWRVLAKASRPRSRVRRGDHLEVSKSRQTLYEVRDGTVVNVIHVSTGATGNTPVGTWRVYREVLGWDWVLYHPMYFLRGFAIHGYPSVPAWPASHGCVRVPLWLANGLRARWGYGSLVRVYG
jgi:Putative peptidoglycan binding domain/L,D-transpeptidase catalytic domain